MRSIVLKEKQDFCGICHSTDDFVEFKEIDGITFLYCKKCDTLNFFHHISYKKQNEIENKLRKNKKDS